MTIARRLYLVLGIMVLLISAELSALWLTIHTLSAVRAYVAGEGLWSKAEKDAAYHLEAYGRTRDPREYRAYLGMLGIWAGDHQANMELASPHPDSQRIFDGFLRGGNDPGDIPGMVSLFARFNRVSFIADAISAWSDGDRLMIGFQQLGTQLHTEVLAKQPDAVITKTLGQIGDVNNQMTVVENRFSDTLGLGSRWLTDLVLKVLLGAALLVELTGLLLTAAITRNISLRLTAMLHASERVAHGDFSVALDERGKDEIGRLAASFNEMTRDVERERTRAEGAVAESDASMREAQRVAHIAAWDWTFANDTMSWSKEFWRLHGVTPHATDVSFAAFASLVHPEDRARVEVAVRGTRESGEPLVVDYRVALPGGSVRWLSAEAKTERDARGTSVRMLGTVRDVTEGRRAEELRLLNAEFGQRALATAELDELKQLATELVANTLGAPFVRLGEFDGDETELIIGAGVGWPEHLLREHALAVSDSPQAAESMRSGRSIFIERVDGTSGLRPSDEARIIGTVASATVPIRGKDSLVGMFHVGFREARPFAPDDKTFLTSIATIVGMAIDRDRREQRIKHLNVELQQRYAELETFSYSVAHDLRAPLRAVSGFASILEEDYGNTLDVDAKRYIGLIVNGAQQMGGLIDALLSLAQVSRQELSSQRVDLSARARSIFVDLRASDPARNAITTVADGITVAGDPALLGDLLANLLGNAWKFTRGREPATIRFDASMRDGEAVYAIRDNGVGFSSSDPEKLFVPFKRLHGKSFEGTGIGLATVARIVHRHGGRVWAESEPGAGATFYFTLGNGAIAG